MLTITSYIFVGYKPGDEINNRKSPNRHTEDVSKHLEDMDADDIAFLSHRSIYLEATISTLNQETRLDNDYANECSKFIKIPNQ